MSIPNITLSPTPIPFLYDSVHSINGISVITATKSTGTWSSQFLEGSANSSFSPYIVLSSSSSSSSPINFSLTTKDYDYIRVYSQITSGSVVYNTYSSTATLSLYTFTWSITCGSTTTNILSSSTIYVYNSSTFNLTITPSTPSSTLSYAWTSSNGNILSGSTTNEITAKPTVTASITYNLIVYFGTPSSNTAKLTTSQVIVVNPAVFVSASQTITSINGTSVTISASALNVSTYTWIDSLGRSYPNSSSITYNPTTATDAGKTIIFYCTVTNSFGSTSTNSVSIQVLYEPTISVNPSSPILLLDVTNSVFGTTYLQTSITSSTPYTLSNYQWYGDTSNVISGATSNTYSVTNGTYSSYAIQALFTYSTYSFTKKSSDASITTVNFSFNVTRTTVFVNADNTSDISITTGYVGSFSYLWTANTISDVSPNILSGSSTYLITTQPTSSSVLVSPVSMIYYVTVTDNDHSTLSTYISVQIDPQISLSASSTITSVGQSITITANLYDTTGVTYNWSTGDTTQIITYTPGSSGTFIISCSATNSYGSITTNTISIKVLSTATITVSPSSPYYLYNSSLSQLGTLQLSSTYSSDYTSMTNNQWYGDSVLIPGATSNTYSVTDLTYSQYYLNGTLNYLTYSIVVNSSPVTLNNIDISLSPSKTIIYSGNSITISANNETYLTYSWSTTNGNITSGSSTYQITAQPTVSSTSTIRYNLVLNANSNISTLTTYQDIVVNPTVSLSASQLTTYVNGPSITISASAIGVVSYTWSDSKGNSYPDASSITFSSVSTSDVGNITFTCLVTNSQGATSTNNIVIRVLGEPSITLSPSTPYFLYDSLKTLYGTLLLTPSYTTNYSASNYKWYGDATQVATTLNYSVTNITYTTYSQEALMTSTIVPSFSDTITSSPLTINYIDITFTPSKTIIYSGNSITISTNNETYLTYLWTATSGGNITSGSSTYEINATPTNTTLLAETKRYTVSLTANSGNSTFSTYQDIEVDPQVYITSTLTEVIVGGDNAVLTANVLNGVSYVWTDSNGGSYPNAQIITYTPSISDLGLLIFTCVVTNAQGATTTNTYTIEVLLNPEISISPSTPIFIRNTNETYISQTTLTGEYTSGLTLVSCQWYGDGNPIPTATSITYVVSNFTTYSSYYITAVLSDLLTTYNVTSASVSLTANDLTTTFSHQTTYSDSVETITLTDISGLEYSWSSTNPNANIIGGALTNEVTIKPTVSGTVPETITYEVQVETTDGTAVLTSSSLEVVVAPQLTIEVIILTSMKESFEWIHNLNETPSVITIYNGNSIQLIASAYYVDTYEWFDDKGNTYPSTESIIYKPDKDVGIIGITCIVTNFDGATSTKTVYIQVLPNVILSKDVVNVYYTDEVIVKAVGGNSYKWTAINRSQYLPDSCYPEFTGDIMKFVPAERDYEYKVTAYDGLGNESSTTLKINVLEKPMSVLDKDLIPIILYDDVINRRKNQIIEKLKKDNRLLNQLTEFYNVTLMSAYKMEFQAKQGRGYRVPWITKYQIVNEQNYMLLSFQQQYQFLKYLLMTRNSNFLFLVNIVQYDFVLPNNCQNNRASFNP